MNKIINKNGQNCGKFNKNQIEKNFEKCENLRKILEEIVKKKRFRNRVQN